jgi:Ras-related GTP-binding protein C/D
LCPECQQDIQQQLQDELADQQLGFLLLSFYLTSIYDHSIFEAFSKVRSRASPVSVWMFLFEWTLCL